MVLYCTVLYIIIPTVLYCTVLYYTVLNCTVLYGIVLYCTVIEDHSLRFLFHWGHQEYKSSCSNSADHIRKNITHLAHKLFKMRPKAMEQEQLGSGLIQKLRLTSVPLWILDFVLFIYLYKLVFYYLLFIKVLWSITTRIIVLYFLLVGLICHRSWGQILFLMWNMKCL